MNDFINEHFSELDNYIKSVARRFSYSIRGMETDDLYQELWLDVCSKNYTEMPLAITAIRNKAKDIYFKEKVHLSDRYLTDDETLCDIFLLEETLDEYLFYISNDDEHDRDTLADIRKIVDSLDGKYRKYVICKMYLDCNIEEYEDEFNSITANLPKNQKDELLGRKKIVKNDSQRNFTGLGIDTLISKYVLNFTSKNYIYTFKRDLKEKFAQALA